MARVLKYIGRCREEEKKREDRVPREESEGEGERERERGGERERGCREIREIDLERRGGRIGINKKRKREKESFVVIDQWI